MLGLLEKLQKIQQKIEFFCENSNKRRYRIHQSRSLILIIVFLLVIIGSSIFLKLPLVLLLIISIIYLLIFGFLFKYDSRKFKEKLALGNKSEAKLETLRGELKKLKVEEAEIENELSHFNRIPSQFKTREVDNHVIRYMERNEAQTIEEALYFWQIDDNTRTTGK